MLLHSKKIGYNTLFFEEKQAELNKIHAAGFIVDGTLPSNLVLSCGLGPELTPEQKEALDNVKPSPVKTWGLGERQPTRWSRGRRAGR